MLYKFILDQRKKLNMSQEYVAGLIGVSRPTYVQIEQGERDITVTEAQKLSDTFNMTLGELLSGNIKSPKVVLEDEKTAKKDPQDITIRVTQKNLRKFKQVLLYILEKVGSRPNFGETVLHKLLYFIDFDYYEKFEENLMGATYIKNHHGPTSVELKTIVEAMAKSGDLEGVKSLYFKYDQKKYLPVKHADLSVLTAREIEHIDGVLARLGDKNAKELENYSHGDTPWKIAYDGEKLSYESVFYRDEKYSVKNYVDDL